MQRRIDENQSVEIFRRERDRMREKSGGGIDRNESPVLFHREIFNLCFIQNLIQRRGIIYITKAQNQQTKN